jgi:hypothetical protein
MQEAQGAKDDLRRRGFKLVEAFRILGISEGTGHALVKRGKLKVVRLGKRLPIVTIDEIDRVLKEGIQ